MPEFVILAAILILAALVLWLALRRPPGNEAALALLQAQAAGQERLIGLTGDRAAQQERLLAEALAAQNQRIGEGQLATAERLAEATAALTASLNVALAGQNDRMVTMAEGLNRAIAAQNERLDQALAGQQERFAKSLAESAIKAQESAGQIHERLAVIDAARQNMEALGAQVTTLAGILGNKQSRGAFGEMQLRQLIEDRLPADGFAWQHTLTNGMRCDCLIRLPFPPGPVVVDSKFPLEAWQALRDAADDAGRLLASRQFTTDMRKHVEDIGRKYLIAGETADAAILFVPSESIFSELHTGFQPVMDEARRRGVFIVSPNTFWAMLTAMRALMQDLRMREQTGKIKQEVGLLVQDVRRLDTRVGNLKKHFDQAQGDIRDIEITKDKIIGRGSRIETAEVDVAEPALLPPSSQALGA